MRGRKETHGGGAIPSECLLDSFSAAASGRPVKSSAWLRPNAVAAFIAGPNPSINTVIRLHNTEKDVDGTEALDLGPLRGGGQESRGLQTEFMDAAPT